MDVSSLHFLVTEDQKLHRFMLVEVLKSLGAQHVEEAHDGSAALECCRMREKPLDVIFSDLSMPGMDGLQLVRHLSEIRFTGALVLTSSHESSLVASASAMADAYGVSVLGIVKKPVSAAAVGTLLERLATAPGKRARGAGERRSYGYGDIEQALAEKQFVAHFQPKVDTLTGEPRGVEALARWAHPEHGMVPPDAFIPQMEASRLVDRLTLDIFGQAVAFSASCRAAGLASKVSINLSPASMHKQGFADLLIAGARTESIQPSQIIFELTETASMTSVGKVLENLARLRMSGFGLAIDDFGTGYSSIQQLSRISFTELKIDRSFVADAARRESGPIILEASITLARKLGIASVAEGVETAEDLELLRRLQCDLCQGYYFAKPMEAQSCLAWMAGHGTRTST